jgi:hypothetical protein
VYGFDRSVKNELAHTGASAAPPYKESDHNQSS